MTPTYRPQDWEPSDAELFMRAAARLIPLGVGLVTLVMWALWKMWAFR